VTLARVVLAAATMCSSAAAVSAQLRVRHESPNGSWVQWWQPDQAPTQWAKADPRVDGAVRWTTVSHGVDRGALSIAGPGEAVRLRIILVRVDPRAVRIVLDANARDDGTLRPWRVDATSVARSAVVALNAGQFTDSGPWGWIVHEGRTVRNPGIGTLAGGVAVLQDGRALVLDADSIQAMHRTGASAAISDLPYRRRQR
jgi:hypothetical protein